MLTQGSVVYGLNGHTYTLGSEIGSGGEGSVFAVSGEPLVIKAYKNHQIDVENKLRYMVMHPVPSLTDQYGNSILSLAWPKDVVFTQDRGFVGYAMPKLENALEIFHVIRGCSTPKAKKLFQNYTWELNVKVARNLALSVYHLHSSGYVIGDMNDKNILVHADGSVCILDTDSFDFTDRFTGVHYKCGVGMPDYLAPELQGRNLRSEGAKFSQATDDFALAIHIFQLLMDNYHPFSCRRLVQPKDSSPDNQRVRQIAEGKCPYIRNIPGYDIPLGAPALDDILPQSLRQDFVQTMDYDAGTALARAPYRTTAEQWSRDLNSFLKDCQSGQLVQCRVNPAHYYLRSKGSCGHCAAERRLQNPTPKTAPVRVLTSNRADPFFQNYDFYVTDLEARSGGMIDVYLKDGKKESHLLPSYLDIAQGKTKVRILSGSASVNISTSEYSIFDKGLTIYNYSSGCLQQYVRNRFLFDVLSDIPGAFGNMMKYWLGSQLAWYGLDWICETIFSHDFFPNLSLSHFFLFLQPFVVSIPQPHFRIVPMTNIWSWIPYCMILLFVWTDGLGVSKRSDCKRELRRRDQL